MRYNITIMTKTMKITKTLFVCGVFFLLCACQQREKVVERPSFGVRTSNTLEINKIVMNDSATVFYVDAFYHPNYWIRIDSGTHLVANGENYPILSSEGIKLNDYHWMPESGQCSFQLTFPALPRSVKTVDFIELDSPDGFNIYDIVLETGKSGISYADAIPKEGRGDPQALQGKMPDVELAMGKTRLTVHLLGYRKDLGVTSLELILNKFLTEEQEEIVAPIDENGDCRFEFEQLGTYEGFLGDGNHVYANTILFPGEEAEIWVDLPAYYRNISLYANQGETHAYYKGKYADLLRAREIGGIYFQAHTMEFFDTIINMDASQYVDYVMSEYEKLKDSIQACEVYPPMTKEYWLSKLRAEVIMSLADSELLFRSAYYAVHDKPYGEEILSYKIPKLSSEDYAVLKELDIDDPKLFFFQDYGLSHSSLYYIEGWENWVDSDHSLLRDLQNMPGIAYTIADMKPLNAEQTEALAQLPPFYKEAVASMQKSMQETIEAGKQKEGFAICEVPQVSDSKLFDAIAARYKGKTVLVDFWATWCGPCRAAIRELEPRKSEFDKEKVAFVYITGETSPAGTWFKTIPDIKGDHYRLTQKQWDYLGEQFKIDGIPTYILIDKNGKYRVREDLRDHDRLVKVLKQS